jgi:hypothetical protein
MTRRALKIVVPGGSGQVGQILARRFVARGDDVVVLSRGGRVPAGRAVDWDGKSLGPWARELDGADVVINLAGRSVNCRYTKENLEAMLSSRVDSTRAVGKAIASASRPPATWLQMSTATIYPHRYDAPNRESDGILGGDEPDTPKYWAYSVRIAREWEAALAEAPTSATRKVSLRTSMVMSPDEGGVFDVLLRLVRRGLGGQAGDGKQYVSWITGGDFARAIDFLIERDDIDGAVNVAAPQPLANRDFMRELRAAAGVRIGLPAAKWMLGIGAWVMRTDPELLLKSRRVVPGRLLDAGFRFDFEEWGAAARELVKRPRD